MFIRPFSFHYMSDIHWELPDAKFDGLFFCMQVLEGVIKYRWNALPVEQRDGMKNYISDVIVQVQFLWLILINEVF